MSLLKMDGFDEYTLSQYKWTFSAGGPGFYAYQAPGVFGYGRYLDSSLGPYYRGAATTELVVGCHFQANGNVDGTWPVSGSLSYFNFYNATTGKGLNSIGVTIDGRLQLNKWSDTFGAPTTILATSTRVINPKVWYWFSFKYIVGNPGMFVIYVNGVEYINFVGDTRGQGVAPETAFTDFIFMKGTIAGYSRYDNMFIMDTGGPAPFNDILPETRIYTLMPVAPGDLTQFTPVGDPDNFENVNNILGTPITDYNESAVPGDIDTFTFPTVTFTGTPQVDAVQIHAVAQKSDAGARDIRLMLRDSGANVFTGAAKSLTATPLGYEDTMLIDPVTGVAWNLSSIGGGAYQFGYEETT